VEDQINRI